MPARPEVIAYARSIAESLPRDQAVRALYDDVEEISLREIAELVGISKARVCQLVDPTFIERQRQQKRRLRRAAGMRALRCGICGELGHNRSGHADFVMGAASTATDAR